METIKSSLVPLRQASLCLDCDMISVAHTHCVACGSAALLNLARTLDGKNHGDLVPGLQMVVSHVPARSAFKTASVPGVRPRPHRPLVRECLPFPKVGGQHPTESVNAHRWYSLRDVAAIVHRAMTMALLAVLVRESASMAKPLASDALAGSKRSQAFNMQTESDRL